MKNNYRVLIEYGSASEYIDILMDLESQQGKSQISPLLTKFTAITSNGERTLVHVATKRIMVIVPL